jgi:hypothetical protein
MLLRDNKPVLLPDSAMPINQHDQILFCGRPDAKNALPLLLNNHKTLSYIIDGEEIADSFIWRWIDLKLKKKRGTRT